MAYTIEKITFSHDYAVLDSLVSLPFYVPVSNIYITNGNETLRFYLAISQRRIIYTYKFEQVRIYNYVSGKHTVSFEKGTLYEGKNVLKTDNHHIEIEGDLESIFESLEKQYEENKYEPTEKKLQQLQKREKMYKQKQDILEVN